MSLCLPSLYEGYGMVIDEPLGVGLPNYFPNGGALLHTADRPALRCYNAGGCWQRCVTAGR